MTDRQPFPDIEALLRFALADLVGGCDSTGTVTPTNLQASLPFIRIMRIGGSDDGFIDSPLVSIDAFAGDRMTAYALSESIRQRLLSGSLTVDGVGTLDNATTATAPSNVPWSDSQDVVRFTASYHGTSRRGA